MFVNKKDNLKKKKLYTYSLDSSQHNPEYRESGIFLLKASETWKGGNNNVGS